MSWYVELFNAAWDKTAAAIAAGKAKLLPASSELKADKADQDADARQAAAALARAKKGPG